ncbi:hypothetical protein C8R43DRAFT_1139200 [Mycena crocata]|nr:hypothetical protein C8R43DRAFT_1139200 [Mycena crocata]
MPSFPPTIIACRPHLCNVLLERILGDAVVPVPAFVPGTPVTPADLASSIPEDEDVQSYWVVLRGREPGMYRSVRAAEEQTRGVPNQYQSRKTGRAEALAFYAANHPEHVKKWVEVPAPVPTANPTNTSVGPLAEDAVVVEASDASGEV